VAEPSRKGVDYGLCCSRVHRVADHDHWAARTFAPPTLQDELDRRHPDGAELRRLFDHAFDCDGGAAV
jgi:hypothetical protein